MDRFAGNSSEHSHSGKPFGPTQAPADADPAEPARPVLIKSVSFPFICEPPSSSRDEFESRRGLDDPELWRNFLNAPETKIGDSDEEIL
jgi:hypothetical protein